MNHTFQIHTFGCKVNTYDSGLLHKNLSTHGFLQNEKPSIHVLNTCAVTAEASKEALKVIRRIKSKEPLSTIVVTGCAAQVDTPFFENLPGADLVVANSHKGMLPFILDQYFKGEIKNKVFKSNIFKKEDLEDGGGTETSHTRSFLKIQDGCNSFCTYCIIPFARGKSRSIPVSVITQKLNALYNDGVREAVLTGVHIGDYEDGHHKLEDLVEKVLAQTQMPRLRLTSLEPVEVSDRLLDLFANEKMCSHFHMSIQSAETDVLDKMKRKYTQDDVKRALFAIQAKVPGAFVGMDVITGFPTETEAQFEETYKTLCELPWTKIHVFPYSERPGTRAVLYSETVPLKERQARAQKLRELSLHRYQSEALRQIGTIKKVLLLKNSEGSETLRSLASDYWPVKIKKTTVIGESLLAKVRITGFEPSVQGKSDGFLVGELC